MIKNNKKQLGLRHAALRKNLKNAADPASSALQLAQFYENGNSSHCDIKKAVHYYKLFLQQNNAADR
jgi:chromosome segregation and condensation protein ScpB